MRGARALLSSAAGEKQWLCSRCHRPAGLNHRLKASSPLACCSLSSVIPVTHSGAGTGAKGGRQSLLPCTKPGIRNLWLGSSRGRRAGPGRQRGLRAESAGAAATARARRFCCSAAPRGWLPPCKPMQGTRAWLSLLSKGSP